MILKPIRWAASKSLYSIDVKNIGLTDDDFNSSDYEDSDYSYSFEYDITKNGVTIDPYSLPNGKYSISYYVKDLLGNEKKEVTNGISEHDIFVSEGDIPAPVFDNLNQRDIIDTEIIDIKWHVTSNKQDKTVLKIANPNKIITNIKEPYNLNSSIIHSESGDLHRYSYSIDGNVIPDGSYKIDVCNCIDMNNFVGCRQNTTSVDIDYKYPSP